MKVKVFKKKLLMVSALYSAFQLVSNPAVAGGDLPSGGVVKSGDIDISRASDSLRILQKTDKGIIEWQDFSVGKHKSVHFQQPSKTSATLNRVTGDFTSKIAGQITATGQVFLVNPNGILITKDGTINTQGFIASTMDITDYNFNKSNYIFSQKGKVGLVENQGTIDVADGGVVALLGGAVKNTGTVNAHLGKISFAGGERIVLSFGDNDFLRVEVPVKDLSTIKDANGNPISDVLDIGGTVTADGGMVQLTVATAAKILRQRISMGGRVQVNTAVRKNGIIRISGGDVKLDKDAKLIANKGNVKIDADTLTSSAVVQASGGNIAVNVAGDTTLHTGASFDVSGAKAGKIAFTAGTRKVSRFKSKADFKADSTAGTGGYIDITANKGFVWLVSGTLSAKGTTQGGRIRVGGAFQGGGYDGKISRLDKKAKDLFVYRWGDSSGLQSAENVTIAKSVTINTIASTGTGGTVIVWSDKATDNASRIDARGANGKGGAVEISGKKTLRAGLSRVYLGGGSLLLDPKNIKFSTNSPNVVSMERTLKAGTDIILRASNDIAVDAEVNTLGDTGTSGKLVLIAGRSIFVTKHLKVEGGLSLIANADDFSHADMTASDRDDGVAFIAVSKGKELKSGNDNTDSTKKNIIIKMLNGVGSVRAKRYSGRISVWKVTGNRVAILHHGTKFDTNSGSYVSIISGGQVMSFSCVNSCSRSDVTILPGGKVRATSLHDNDFASILSIKTDRFTNQSDANALEVAKKSDGTVVSRYLVWLYDPSYATLNGINNYDFGQYQKAFYRSGSDFQENVTIGSKKKYGPNEAGSGLLYTGGYSGYAVKITLQSKDKQYDGKSTVDMTGVTASLVNKSYTNKLNQVKVEITNNVTAKYYNTAGSAEQKNVGTNLTIKFKAGQGWDFVRLKDGNNKRLYGTYYWINNITGARITPKVLNIHFTDLRVVSKTYDGTKTATVTLKRGRTGYNTSQLASGDTTADVVLDINTAQGGTGVFEFADKNADTNKSIKFLNVTKFKFTGAKGGNYRYNAAYVKGATAAHPSNAKNVLKGTITKRTLKLNLADLKVNNRPFTSGNVNAPVVAKPTKTGFVAADRTTGIVGGDTVTLKVNSGAFVYDTDTKENNKQVRWGTVANLGLDGADAGNYTLDLRYYRTGDTISGLIGNIIGYALTITQDVYDKQYDGTKTLQLKGAKTITGWQVGDGNLSRVWNDVFKTGKKTLIAESTTKNAGLQTVVFKGLELNDAYKTYGYVIQFAPKTVTIAQKTIVVDVTLNNRQYDGTTALTSSGATVSGIVRRDWIGNNHPMANDVFSPSDLRATVVDSSGKGDKNVGNNKPTAIVILYIKPKYRTNYKISLVPKTVNITPRELVVTADVDDRQYDKTTKNFTIRNKTFSRLLQADWTAAGGSGDVSTATLADITTGDFEATVASKDSATNKAVIFVGKAGSALTLKSPYTTNYKLKYDTTKTVTINKIILTVTVNTPSTRVYDGTNMVAVKGTPIVTGWAAGEEKTWAESVRSGSLMGFIQDSNASPTPKRVIFFVYPIRMKDTGHFANYRFRVRDKKIIITKRELTLKPSDFKAVTKVYDGTTKASSAVVQLKGRFGRNKGVKGVARGDWVTFTITGDMFKFNGKDVSGASRGARAYFPIGGGIRPVSRGTNLVVADNSKLNDGLDSISKRNYKFNYSTGANTGIPATITPKTVTLNGYSFNHITKAYDKPGKILAKDVSLKRIYYYTNAGQRYVTLHGLVGTYQGDDVAVTVGDNALVASNSDVGGMGAIRILRPDRLSLSGKHAKNYKFDYKPMDIVKGLRGKIVPKVITLKADDFTVDSKVYDGTEAVKGTQVKLKAGKTGLYYGSGAGQILTGDKDNVTLTIQEGALEYFSKDVNGNIGLRFLDTSKLKLTGTRASNYKFAYSAYRYSGLTGAITPKTVTLNANDFNPLSKTYDNTGKILGAGVSLKKNTTGVIGVLGNDKVTVAVGDEAFVAAHSNVGGMGAIRILKPDRLGFTGTHAKNYKFNYAANTIIPGLGGTITAKVITLKADDFTISKVYNGTKTLKATHINLKTGKTGFYYGVAAGQIISSDKNKVTLTIEDGALEYASKDVDGAIQLNVVNTSKLKLTGTQARNYKFAYAPNTDSGLTGAITPKTVTLNANDFNPLTKVYDKTGKITGASVSLKKNTTGIIGVVGNDKVTVRVGDGAFYASLQNVGSMGYIRIWKTDKLGFTGTHAKNYKFNYGFMDIIPGIKGTITQKVITLKTDDFTISKVYDGTKTVKGTHIRLKTGKTGLDYGLGANQIIPDDTANVNLEIQDGALEYASKDVDGAIRLNVVNTSKLKLTGIQARNYKFTYVSNTDSGLTGAITARILTLKTDDFKAITKTYDGGMAVASVSLKFGASGLNNIVSGESIKLTVQGGALVYENKNVAGGRKKLNVANYNKLQLIGLGASNYKLDATKYANGKDSGLTGTISKRILTLKTDDFKAITKTYDGDTTVAGVLLKSGASGLHNVISGEKIKLTVQDGALVYKNKNVAGGSKKLNVANYNKLQLIGSGASNYKLNATKYANGKDSGLTGTITKKTLIVTANVAPRTYDGTTGNLSLSGATVSGWVSRDTGFTKTLAAATASGTLVGTAASKDIGTPAVTFSGLTIKTTVGTYGNYKFAYATDKTVTITQKIITLNTNDFTPITKVYDGDGKIAAARVWLKSNANQMGLAGVFAQDKVTLNIKDDALIFVTKDVAKDIQINIANKAKLELSGADAGNYKFSYSQGADSGLKGTITKKTLIVTANVAPRTYDGTTGNLSLSGATVSGWVSRDSFTKTLAAATASGTLVGTAASKDVGTLAVTFSGLTFKTTTGTYGNYKFVYATDKTVTITQKVITLNINDFQAISKVYDGGTSVKGATVKQKTTGSPTGFNETIYAQDKPTLAVEDGALVYASKNVHGAIQLNVADYSKLKLTGTGAGNYKLNPTTYANGKDSGFTGAITQKVLRLKASDFKQVRKTYDGTTAAKVELKATGNQKGLEGVIGNDKVAVVVQDGAIEYVSKDVDISRNFMVKLKVADVNKLKLSGGDAGNYKFNSAYFLPPLGMKDWYGYISKRELTLKTSDFETVSKTYDGTTHITTTIVRLKTGNDKTGLTAANGNKGVVSGDRVTFTIAADMFKFNSKDVANADKLLVTTADKLNAGLGGASKDNYKFSEFTYTNNASSGIGARITKRELTLKPTDFKAVSKSYDGNTDIVELLIWKPPTVIVQLKTDAGQTGLTAANGNKGVVSGDTVKFVVKANMFKFNSKDVATANRLLVTTAANLNAGLGGASKGNYEFKYANNANSGITARINPKSISIESRDFKVTNRVYKGSSDTSATVTRTSNANGAGIFTVPAAMIGRVGNDKVKLKANPGAFVFKDGNAGVNKELVIGDPTKLTLEGAQASNYVLAYKKDDLTGGLKGTISKRELTLKPSDFESVTKSYDGTTHITTTIVQLKTGNGKTGLMAANGNKGVVRGDTVKFVVAANMFKFNSKNVAAANRLLVTTAANLNAGLDSTSKGNYEFKYANNADSGIAATITRKIITLNASDFNPITKTYDGIRAIDNSRVTLKNNTSGLSGVEKGDTVTLVLRSTYVFTLKSRNVATDLDVYFRTPPALGGKDAGNYKFNYSIADPTGLKATITKKVLTLNANDFNAITKVYDGTTTVTGVTVTLKTPGNQKGLIGVLGNEAVSLTVKTGALVYADKNVAAGKLKIADASKLELSGAEAGNYKFGAPNTDSGLTGAITPKTVTLNANDFNPLTKVYDKTGKITGASVSLKRNTTGIIGVVGNDKVTVRVGDDAFYASLQNVGSMGYIRILKTDKLGFTGTHAKNYKFNYKSMDIIPGIKGTITQRVITLKADDFTISKVYDGTKTVKGIHIQLKTGKTGLDYGLGAGQVITDDTANVILTIEDGALEYTSKDVAGNIQLNFLNTSKLKLTGLQAGNYKFGTPNTDSGLTGAITPKTVTLNANDFNPLTKTYDNTGKIAGAGVSLKQNSGLIGVVGSDKVTVTVGDHAFVATNSNVGGMGAIRILKPDRLGFTGTHAKNYKFNYAANTIIPGLRGTITAKVITLKADDFTVDSKVYDGTGAVKGTQVQLKTGKTGFYYGLAAGQILSGDRDKVTLTIQDGALEYASKDVDGAIRLHFVNTSKLKLTGTQARNYTFAYAPNTDSGLRAAITPKTVTLNGNDFNPISKIYDRTVKIAGASVSLKRNTTGLIGVVGNDKVTVAVGDEALFASQQNVGDMGYIRIWKPDKLGFSGTHAKNYKFDYKFLDIIPGIKGTITPKVITLKADDFTVSKVYDGTKAIKGTQVQLKTGKTGFYYGLGAGQIFTDDKNDVTLSIQDGAFEYASKDVGKNIQLHVVNTSKLKLTGLQARNYKFLYPQGGGSGLTGTITKKTLIVTANVAPRVYDGTTGNLSLSGATVSGWVSGDGFTKTLAAATASGTLVGTAASKDVGTPAVIFSGLTFKTTTGTYGNYKFAYATDKTVTITQKVITLNANDFNQITKTYDGQRAIDTSKVTLKNNATGLNGVEQGDTVTLVLQSANIFTLKDKNANTNKDVYMTTPPTLGGKDAGNYKFNYSSTDPTGLKATVTKRILILNPSDFNAVTKVYDGTTTVTGASVTLKTPGNQKGLFGVFGNEAVSLTVKTGALVYVNKNVVAGRVSLRIADTSKLELSGAGAGNYKFYVPGFSSGLTGKITKKTVTLNKDDFTISKVYDGTKAVKRIHIKLKTGKTGLNYGLGSGQILTGDKNNVNLEIQDGALEYVSKDVAGNIQLNFANTSKLKLTGTQARNYTFGATNTDSGLRATITPKTVTLNTNDFNPITKTYDRTGKITGASVSLKKNSGLIGVVSGDNVTVTVGDEAFVATNSNVGSMGAIRILKPDRLGFTGTHAKNYKFNYAANTIVNGLKGTITPKVITLNMSDFTVGSKVYDGTKTVKHTQVQLKTGKTGLYYGSGAGQILMGDKDKVTLSIQDGALEYISKDVHGAIQLNVVNTRKLKLTGTQSSNYIAYAPTGSGLKAAITPKTVTLNANDFNPLSKIYDNTGKILGAGVSLKKNGGLIGVVGNDNVTVTVGDNAFVATNSNVGSMGAIRILKPDRLGFTGTHAKNYKFNYTANTIINGLKGTITPKVITLNKDHFTISKVYDGTKTLKNTQINLKTGKTGFYYGLAAGQILSSDKNKVTLTIQDGALEYASKDVDGAIQLRFLNTSKLKLTGTQARNYKFAYTPNTQSTLTGAITPKTVTLNGNDFNPITKIYDKTGKITGASVSLKRNTTGIIGVVGNDKVTVRVGDDAFYASLQDVGSMGYIRIWKTDKLGFTGTHAKNYKFNYKSMDIIPGIKGTITQKVITLKMDDFTIGKVYDGTKTVKSTHIQLKTGKTGLYYGLGAGQVIPDDTANVTLTIQDGALEYVSKDVNGNIALNFANISKFKLTGIQAGNYKFLYSQGAYSGFTGTISKKVLTLNLGDLKTADRAYATGNVKAPVGVNRGKSGFTMGGVVGSDDVKLNIAANAFRYANDTAGNNKQVLWAAKAKVTLNGTKAGNYILDLSGYTDNTNAGNLTGNIISRYTLPTSRTNYKYTNNADSTPNNTLGGTIKQVISSEAVHIFKNVMKTNPLTGSAVFSARQREFVPLPIFISSVDKKSTSGNFVVFLTDTSMIATLDKQQDEDNKDIILTAEE